HFEPSGCRRYDVDELPTALGCMTIAIFPVVSIRIILFDLGTWVKLRQACLEKELLEEKAERPSPRISSSIGRARICHVLTQLASSYHSGFSTSFPSFYF
ncbi:hypothetical protein CLAIMM_03267 isoform 2, partial [Cladophialophora immunda]